MIALSSVTASSKNSLHYEKIVLYVYSLFCIFFIIIIISSSINIYFVVFLIVFVSTHEFYLFLRGREGVSEQLSSA